MQDILVMATSLLERWKRTHVAIGADLKGEVSGSRVHMEASGWGSRHRRRQHHHCNHSVQHESEAHDHDRGGSKVER